MTHLETITSPKLSSTASARKRTRASEKPEKDAAARALVKRYNSAWTKEGRLATKDEDDPRLTTLAEECLRLAVEIFITPTRDPVVMAEKRRIFDQEGLVAEDIIEEILLRRDAERVAG